MFNDVLYVFILLITLVCFSNSVVTIKEKPLQSIVYILQALFLLQLNNIIN